MFKILALCVLSAFLLLSGCISTGTQTNGTGMPNPASVYCEQHGGVLEIKADANGSQSGVCKFANGGQCDEWAYYRGECGTNQTNQTNGGTNGTGGGTIGGGTGMANPASVYCEDNGGTLEIREGEGGQYGVCMFPGGVQCEEWAFFRGECNATSPTYCDSTADCACGVQKETRQCFYGNKDYVDTAQQCPDFCNGIAAHLEIVCSEHKCIQVQKDRCKQYGVDNCTGDCVVCPPCPECSSISCQSQQACESMGFNSTWYKETHG